MKFFLNTYVFYYIIIKNHIFYFNYNFKNYKNLVFMILIKRLKKKIIK